MFPHLPRKSVIVRFALLFLPAACLFTAIIWPVLNSYEKGRISIIKARESGYLDVATRLIKSEFSRSISDLSTLARDPCLQRYLDEGTTENWRELARLFLVHAEGYQRYDQIRLLDAKGEEVIRVNYHDDQATVIPPAQLQNKGQRYYFLETSKLDEGDIYVSPIDLNMEHGQIEIPYKPTIRFATPLFDSKGKRMGVLIFNYLGNILLQAFHNDMMKDPLHEAMLLNSDSYWISSPKTDQEWGFMLKQKEVRFSTIFPTAWAYINKTMQGEFTTDSELMLFTTVHPLINSTDNIATSTTIRGVNNKLARDYYWKLVLFVSSDSLYATSFIRNGQGKILLFSIYFLLVLLAFLITIFSLLSEQRRKQEKITASEIEDLYNHAPCGYHSLDNNSLIVKINQTELNWLGYSADEIIGKRKYPELLTENSLKTFHEKFPEFIQQGYIRDVELEVVRKDGSLLPIMVSATAVRDSNNNIVMSRSTVFDMTERKRLEQRLFQQATTDFLTGLNNRRHFYKLAEIELARIQRTDKPLSLLIMDLDHFKKLNDTHGHNAGDIALQTFSSICRDQLREIDILGRLGGEEFAALLPETPSNIALEVARRLCTEVSSTPITISTDTDIHMTVSIGVTAHAISDHTIQDMLKRADKALYAAKNGGRNRVHCEEM